MAKNESIYVKCDCGCCVLEISRYDWGDYTEYNVAVLDSRYDHKANGLLNRVRNALKVLFGKKIYYNDVCMTEEQFDRLVGRIHELRWTDTKGRQEWNELCKDSNGGTR